MIWPRKRKKLIDPVEYHTNIIEALTDAVYGSKYSNLNHEDAAKHFPSSAGFRTSTGYAYEILMLIDKHKILLQEVINEKNNNYLQEAISLAEEYQCSNLKDFLEFCKSNLEANTKLLELNKKYSQCIQLK